MTEDHPSPARLDDLRRKWAEAPTPRLAVRLADELHRRGETADAVDVLEKGLAADPDHLAARVALGRYRLELGDLAAARRTLETVVDRDPTHLLANRLLADLYIRLGETDLARDRLDLYILLNDRDPEIEALERRLAGEAEAGPSSEVKAPEPAAAQPSEDFEPAPPEPAEAFQLVELEPEGAAAPGPAATPPPAPRVEPRPALRGRPPGPSPGPFGDLWSEALAGRYWFEIAAEGIFPLPAAAPPAGPAAEPKGAPDRVTAQRPAVKPAAAGESVAVTEEATVTLAELYRKQGHSEEAERIYRRVLERHPDNAAALAGLAAVAPQPVPGDTPEAVGKPPGAGPATAVERKKAALRDYLRRIRGGAGEPG